MCYRQNDLLISYPADPSLFYNVFSKDKYVLCLFVNILV